MLFLLLELTQAFFSLRQRGTFLLLCVVISPYKAK